LSDVPESGRLLHKLRSTVGRAMLEIEAGEPLEAVLASLQEAIAILDQLQHEEVAGLDGTVLVIDDDQRLAEVTARRLARVGFTTRAFQDLLAARSVWTPDVRVVMDLGLLYDEVPALVEWALSCVPVIVTGASARESERMLRGAKVRALLQKPVDFTELIAALRRRPEEE